MILRDDDLFIQTDPDVCSRPRLQSVKGYSGPFSVRKEYGYPWIFSSRKVLLR